MLNKINSDFRFFFLCSDGISQTRHTRRTKSVYMHIQFLRKSLNHDDLPLTVSRERIFEVLFIFYLPSSSPLLLVVVVLFGAVINDDLPRRGPLCVFLVAAERLLTTELVFNFHCSARYNSTTMT